MDSSHERREGMVDLAARLPTAHARVDHDPALRAMPKDRALAAAFRLLDHGFFPVGSEAPLGVTSTPQEPVSSPDAARVTAQVNTPRSGSPPGSSRTRVSRRGPLG